MIAPGELTVHVGTDATGRTRVTTLRQRYPQRVTTALHSDDRFPGAAVLCVQSPSGGTFSDDDLRTTVVCAPGSHLVLTTQSATQVFAGDGPGARHQLRFTVHTGAVLEYIPRTLIPQAGSQFTQTLDVDVAEGGRYIGWEAVAAGRIAHGERFRYAGVDTAITVRSGDRMIARDRQRFTPDVADALDGDYVATQLAVTPGLPTALESARAALTNLSGVRAGASELPNGAGLFSRMTADRAPELRRAQQALHTAVRDAAPTSRPARSA
ncbi:urease accessory protein UreD [Mycobacterium sp. URHD0025]|uniref:urease accessory protein UreD n=1 Tax=Mycobacterium sp. URHD0025 TaxID=1298864 RepID=UPI00041B187E|nr:urease accessory protein UreD [Mycobacterium sp. URHD0025]